MRLSLDLIKILKTEFEYLVAKDMCARCQCMLLLGKFSVHLTRDHSVFDGGHKSGISQELKVIAFSISVKLDMEVKVCKGSQSLLWLSGILLFQLLWELDLTFSSILPSY